MQAVEKFFLKRNDGRRSGAHNHHGECVDDLRTWDDADTGAPSSIGVEWATPVRYSDSTSYSESCASDQTAASTIHSCGASVTYHASFRPRSANEPPVPANFIRSISCSDEQSGRLSDNGHRQGGTRRRRSIDSMLSEYSGYVSVRTISPHPVFDHDSTFDLPFDESDLDERRSSYSPRRRSHHNRSSSANSSTVFVWAGMAHKGRRPSQTSYISEYSGDVSDFAGEVSPRYDASSMAPASARFFRREPSPSFRKYPNVQRGRRRQSYTAPLESQPIPELPFLERRHSFTSSASSGRSITDFLQQEAKEHGRDDQAWFDEEDFEEGQYDNEYYRAGIPVKPHPRHPSSNRPALRIFIPSAADKASTGFRSTPSDDTMNASNASNASTKWSKSNQQEGRHQTSRRPLRRSLPPELIDHPREYHTSLSYRMIQVEDTTRQSSSMFSWAKMKAPFFRSRQR